MSLMTEPFLASMAHMMTGETWESTKVDGDSPSILQEVHRAQVGADGGAMSNQRNSITGSEWVESPDWRTELS